MLSADEYVTQHATALEAVQACLDDHTAFVSAGLEKLSDIKKSARLKLVEQVLMTMAGEEDGLVWESTFRAWLDQNIPTEARLPVPKVIADAQAPNVGDTITVMGATWRRTEYVFSVDGVPVVRFVEVV